MHKAFWATVIFLSLFLILFSFHTINLSTADIGRHIMNGDVFLHSAEHGVSKADILYKNFFSYTYPDFPFVNHHWLFGIATYVIYSIFGFGGLSFIYFLCILGALIFTLRTLREETDISGMLFAGIFLIPLLATRVEIRPEGLSFFLLAFFIFFLARYARGKVSCRHLFILPLLVLLWANAHVFYILGIFVIGVFLADALFFRNKEQAHRLLPTFVASIAAACITPYGIEGLLYPLTVVKNYGYRIVENQSIPFLENLSFANPDFLWYKAALLFFAISSMVVFIKRRSEFIYPLTAIAFIFGIMGYVTIRSIPLFAIVAIPLFAYNATVLKKLFAKPLEAEIRMILSAIFFFTLISATLFQFSAELPWNRKFGAGTEPGGLAPIEFIKTSGIHGPFFTNYDVAGLMIFGLYPTEKVFVDNRPEAYPREFFEDVYVPMQEDDEVWGNELLKNKFNAIFFYRLDYTPWAQNFLIERVKDPAWAPVYVDDVTIIFLKRNEANAEIIKKYELPKEMFNIQS